VNWSVSATGTLDLGAVAIVSANVGMFIKLALTFDGTTPVLDTSDAVWDLGDAGVPAPSASKTSYIFGEIVSTSKIRAWWGGVEY
jgi:hypothetical protein